MALTNEQVRDILATSRVKARKVNANGATRQRYLIAQVTYDRDGNIRPGRAEWVSGSDAENKPPAALIGKFEGKAGSVRRSRKGVTTRQANGRRYLLSSQPDMTGSTTQVLAYYV